MLLNYHIRRFVLVSLCVEDLVRLGLSCCASACYTDTTTPQPHQIPNTQRTENKTTDVVIQQHSCKLLMMDILMSETCWLHKKWNKIGSDIKLVFYSSTITMMHGPINIRCRIPKSFKQLSIRIPTSWFCHDPNYPFLNLKHISIVWWVSPKNYTICYYRMYIWIINHF